MMVDILYQDRLETLLSVDDLVDEVVTTLQTAGILDNTYIFYNSNHGICMDSCMWTFHLCMLLFSGYHHGQFKQQVSMLSSVSSDCRG